MRKGLAILLGVGATGLAGLGLVAMNAVGDPVAVQRTRTAVPTEGFTFTSATLDLPADPIALPAGPNRALVEANCTDCHSAEMLTTQPPLKPAQWAATVKKMREVYHAPVAPGEDAAIAAYLGGLNALASVPSRRP